MSTGNDISPFERARHDKLLGEQDKPERGNGQDSGNALPNKKL